MKLEAKIGLFVVAALSALLFLSTQVTSLGKWGQKGYAVNAYVDNASGVERYTHVAMNGVLIGEVEAISIDGKRVRLTLSINEGVVFPDDSSVVVVQESLLGSKVINIVAGNSSTTLRAGGTLVQSKQYASFDQTSDSVNAAAKEFELLLRDFRSTLDDEHRKAIQDAIIAFRDVSTNLNGVVVDNRADLHAAITNFKIMSAGFSQSADTINKDLPSIMGRIDSLATRGNASSAVLKNAPAESIVFFNPLRFSTNILLTLSSIPTNLVTASGSVCSNEPLILSIRVAKESMRPIIEGRSLLIVSAL